MKPKYIISILLFLSLIFSNSSYCQKDNEIDSIVKEYPKSFSNIEALAAKIQKDFTTEYSKARAIYTWMALNINYDVKAWMNPPQPVMISYRNQLEKKEKERLLEEKMINNAFKSRKAVCSGYAFLYSHLATLVGLKTQIIEGTSKTILNHIGKRELVLDHAWNSVQIDGTWRLVDVTWGSGYFDDYRNKYIKQFKSIYFDTPEKLFFAKHYPKEGIWQDKVIDKNEFLEGPLLYNDFIEGKYEMIEPKNGILEVHKNQKITFKILNLSNKLTLRYSIKNNGAEVIANKKLNDNVLEFEITMDKTIGKYMTLYLDDTAIAAFKIVFKS